MKQIHRLTVTKGERWKGGIKYGFAINIHTVGFPGGSAGKEAAYNAGGSWFNSWIRKIPRRKTGYLLEHSWASLVAQTGI